MPPNVKDQNQHQFNQKIMIRSQGQGLKKNNSADKIIIEKRIWKMILITISAFCHFQTFLASLRLLLSCQQPFLEDVVHILTVRAYNLEKSCFLAYCLDLFCVSQNVIPFSRSSNAKDILIHHLPVLLVFLPLGVPTWSLWTSAEPILVDIVYSADVDVSRGLVTNVATLDAMGLISSLNEMIMCLQRVELLWYNKQHFNDMIEDKHHYKRFMTSRWVIGFELYYKLLIFTVFPVINLKASIGVYRLYYNHTLLLDDTFTSWFHYVKMMLLSPLIWRITLYLLFMLSLYPGMAKRVFGRIKDFHTKR